MLVIFGVILLIFLLFHVLPADPARLTLGQRSDMSSLQNVRRELHLDKPLWQQLLWYLNDVSPLGMVQDSSHEQTSLPHLSLLQLGPGTRLCLKQPNLQRSYQSKRPVWNILMSALPGTLVLALASILLAAVLGIALGVLAASRQGSWLDSGAVFGSVLGISSPSFFTGILLAYVVAYLLHGYTGLHMTGSLFVTDPFRGRTLALKNLILPALTLGLRPLAIITQLTRSSMLDVLGQDYIRTAYAKGLSRRAVLLRHALPNALNPVVTAITGWLAELLAGSFFVEYIFGWQGIGKVTVDALEKFDFPVLMGSILVIASLFVLVNILADLVNAWIDPRIRLV